MDATTILPIVTLALGYILKTITDYVNEGRITKREKAARREVRNAAAREKHAAFQPEKMLQLQAALMAIATHTTTRYELFLGNQEVAGEWNPGDMNDRHRPEELKASVQEATMVEVLIQDDIVRAESKVVRRASTGLDQAASDVEGADAMAELVRALEAANERIGKTIRTIDSEEVSS